MNFYVECGVISHSWWEFADSTVEPKIMGISWRFRDTTLDHCWCSQKSYPPDPPVFSNVAIGNPLELGVSIGKSPNSIVYMFTYFPARHVGLLEGKPTKRLLVYTGPFQSRVCATVRVFVVGWTSAIRCFDIAHDRS